MAPFVVPNMMFTCWLSADGTTATIAVHLPPVPIWSQALPHSLPRSRSHIDFKPMDSDDAFSSLDVAIGALNIAKEATGVTLAKATLGCVSVVLTTVRVGFLPGHAY